MHELEQILAGVSRFHKSEREEAMRIARALPPEDLLQLVELYNRKFARDRRRHMNLLVGLMVLVVSLLVLLGESIFGDPIGMRLAPVLLLLPLVLMGCHYPERNAMAGLIADVDSPVFVGAISLLLSEYHFGDNRRMRDQLFATLERLVPQLKPEHTRQWTNKQRTAVLFPLHLMLQTNSTELTSSCLIIPTLYALEQMGDSRELALVRRVAARRVKTDFDRDIHEAAVNCLPFLETRAEEQSHAKTLLRASEAASATPDVLLRSAAAYENKTVAEQLLRPQA